MYRWIAGPVVQTCQRHACGTIGEMGESPAQAKVSPQDRAPRGLESVARPRRSTMAMMRPAMLRGPPRTVVAATFVHCAGVVFTGTSEAQRPSSSREAVKLRCASTTETETGAVAKAAGEAAGQASTLAETSTRRGHRRPAPATVPAANGS